MSPRQIKALRKRLKLSQAKLAIAIGVSHQAVQYWEQGKGQPHAESRNKLVQLTKAGR